MSIANEFKGNKRLLEIEGLRAVAVLAVIVNHFFEVFLPSGFLGVDVFFVVSGYVISRSLVETSYASWSSFLLSFFARRIKRLFPALFVCVFITSLAFLFLTSRPSVDVFRTGAAALFGGSNIFLYIISSDYFSIDSQLNPFTHTWSLGVEEQFYLLFPFILGFAGYVQFANRVSRRHWFVLPAIFVLSLGTWSILGFQSPSAQFYLLPGRMWQLCLGAICFLFTLPKERALLGRRYLADIALAFLFAAFLLSDSMRSVGTLVATIMTGVFLIFFRSGEGVSKLLASGPMVGVGGLSYSLYLWHWSLLVLGRWTFGETPLAKAVYLIAAFVFALISYRFIEQPIRSMQFKSHFLVIAGAIFSSLGAAYVIAVYVPQKAISTNNLLAEAAGVPEVPWVARNRVSWQS